LRRLWASWRYRTTDPSLFRRWIFRKYMPTSSNNSPYHGDTHINPFAHASERLRTGTIPLTCTDPRLTRPVCPLAVELGRTSNGPRPTGRSRIRYRPRFQGIDTRRGIESSTRLCRHRYVIERRLEWVTRFRRLVRRYERKASHFLGFLRLACAIICYRRAVRLNLLTSNNAK